MRKIAAAALALPAIALVYFTKVVRRSAIAQFAAVGLAVVLVVAGLLVGLPIKDVSGTQPGTIPPLTPAGVAGSLDSTMALDAPFQIVFNKPMNANAVASALAITPNTTSFKLSWDANGRILSLVPATHWDPYTSYHVTIAASATDQQGMTLNAPIGALFSTGSLTSGSIKATEVVNGDVAPASAFEITFSRPVKLATVASRFSITPNVDASITGDDPTDAASQTFTLTPTSSLAPGAKYTLSFFGSGATDSAGAPLSAVDDLKITTMAAPEVVRFRPRDKTSTLDPGQPVSVRFTEPMDRPSTEKAFSVSVGGKAVGGSLYWAENDTVLVLDLSKNFKIGSKVLAKVGAGAKSKDGMSIKAAAQATFTVARPASRKISWSGGIASASSPWYGAELYYLRLMNCTRTGGWVTTSGDCSTATHHTMPAQSALSLNAGISNRVSRPYAKYMADHRVLSHYLAGTTPRSRMAAAGYSGGGGENIASPPSVGQSGMIKVEIFYQNEYRCRCEHYGNIMDPYYRTAGIGIWVSRGAVRVVIDFL
jgi:Bacterial Ig-like domain